MNGHQFQGYTQRSSLSMLALLSFVYLLLLGVFQPAFAGVSEYAFPSEPQLRLNPAMHTAAITGVDIDRLERFAVTASDDKSVLVWDLSLGQVLKRLRVPAGEGHIGKVYAVAISPDGEQIAVGGYTGKDGNHLIYIYQRSTGVITQKITGLEIGAAHLSYSPDGSYLAATLGLANGLRVYKTTGYRQIYADRDYQEDTYWVSWRSNRNLVTSSFDGKIRLYKKNTSNWELVTSFDTGRKPFGLAVNPDGTLLAVGFFDNTELLLLDLPSLKTVASPPTNSFNNGNFGRVSWSHTGDRLWAGGQYDNGGYSPVLGWWDAKGDPVSFPITTNSVMSMLPLTNGDLLVASLDGLTRISAQGDKRWQLLQPLADFRDQLNNRSIRLSSDGSRVAFGFRPGGKEAAWWDLTQNKLWADSHSPPPWDKHLLGATTKSGSVAVTNWKGENHPTLNGRKLNLRVNEISRSLAIAPDRQELVLGTEWYLRRFDREGHQVWERAVPGVVWAVAISSDGRWVVAGLGDGTLRWYDYQRGEEKLAFFPHNNRKEWVIWTPEGFFASSSPTANALFGYQLNNGTDAPDFIKAEQLYTSFYRPDLVLAQFEGHQEPIQQALAKIGDVRQVLQSRPPRLALTKPVPKEISTTQFTLPITITDEGGGIGELSIRVNGVRQSSKAGTRTHHQGIHHTYELKLALPSSATSNVEILAPDAKGLVDSEVLSVQVTSTAKMNNQKPKLVGLAIGIEHYEEGSFKLNYAIDDINAFKKTLEETGQHLYRNVKIKTLPDATYDEIVNAFEDIQKQVGKDDVFVLYLSGHGVTDNANYHFLAQDFIWDSPRALENKTIDSHRLNDFLASIQARKAVVFFDTCYAGSYKPEIDSLVALNLVKKSGPSDKQAISRLIEETTAVERLNQLSGRAFFYASTDQDVALEGYKDHSLYTALLLEGLRSAPSVDQHISLSELRAFLNDTMPDVSEKLFNTRLHPLADVPTNFNFVSK